MTWVGSQSLQWWLCMGDRGHKPRHVSSLCRWDRPGSLPWSSQKGTKPAHTLISAQGDPCQMCDLQNSKMINLCCFKPLNLRWCVTVANQKLTHSSLRPTLPGSPLLPGSPQSSWLAPPAPHRAYLTPSPSIFHPRVISPRLTALQFMSPDKTSLTLLDSGLLGTATAVSEKHPKSIQPKRTPDTPPSASLVSIMSTNINAAAEAASEESFVTPAPPPHPIPRVLTPPPPKVTLLFSSSLLPSSLTKIANHCNSLGLVSLSVTEQPEDGSANKKPTLDLSLPESPPSSDFRLLKKSQVLVLTKDLKI